MWKGGGNSGGFAQDKIVTVSDSLSSKELSMWERLNIHALRYLGLQALYDWLASKHP